MIDLRIVWLSRITVLPTRSKASPELAYACFRIRRDVMISKRDMRRATWGSIICLASLLVSITLTVSPACAASLSDLGFPDGVTLQGRSARASVYVPIPPGAPGGRLVLNFAASTAIGAQSAVTVEIDRMPVATVPVGAAGTPVSIGLPAAVLRDLGRKDYAKLTFVADIENAGTDRCWRSGRAADWIRIAPTTALVPTGGKSGIGAAWRDLAVPVTITLPDKPTLAQADSALILSTALVERGITPFITESSTTPDASIRIAQTRSGAGDGGARLTTGPGGKPQIVVSSAAAARALVLADRLVSARLASSLTAQPNGPRKGAGRSASFAAIGIASSMTTVVGSADIPIPLATARLPVRRHVSAIVLNARGAALPPGEAEAVTLMVGNEVVWSRAFRAAPVLDHVRVGLPTRLLAGGAQVTLRLTRLNVHDACARPQPLPFTLKDSSRLILAPGIMKPTTFAGFSPAGGGTVPVLTDLAPQAIGPSLPLVAQLLGKDDVDPVSVRLGKADVAPARPFVLIAHVPGTMVANAPLLHPHASGAGPVTLELPNRSASLKIPDVSADSVLQLVQTSAGMPGLWLDPGPRASLAQAVLPGSGNIAFYTGASAPATFDTVVDRADEARSGMGSVESLVAAWRTQVFIALWLIIALLMVLIVTRRRRRK